MLASTGPHLAAVLAALCLLKFAHSLKSTSISVDESKSMGAIDAHKWPQRQINVLLDKRSLNESEQLMLASVFNQIEHRTCLKIALLPDNWMNLTENQRHKFTAGKSLHFVHMAKSSFETFNKLVGFSTLGCARQERQSLILTDLAFKWPDTVLRYHIMRTMGLDNLERPREQYERPNDQPKSQRIGDDVPSTTNRTKSSAHDSHVTPLREEDLELIKRLYNCPELQNRLSVKPILSEFSGNISHFVTAKMPAQGSHKSVRFLNGTTVSVQSGVQLNETIIKSVAKELMAAESDQTSSANPPKVVTRSYCSDTQQSCQSSSSAEMVAGHPDSISPKLGIPSRPMILKLDEHHAQDPHILKANQIKITQNAERGGSSPGKTVRLQQPFLPYPFNGGEFAPQTKSELIMSFETNNQLSSNPVDALVTSQVLKLCSCTCQTMKPATQPPTDFPPFTETPTTFTPQTEYPTITRTPTTRPTEFPPFTRPMTLEPTVEPTLTEPPTTVTPTQTPIPTTATTTQQPTPRPTPPETSPKAPVISASYCDLVEWVQPNKTIYSSSRIVWDVDRGNQNYFICNNMINGELVPGKTHGFSCKVSSEGLSYEMYNFSVLTKPEHVSLAWVQRNSDSFGKTNFPVIGGFSKSQDPYIVSRCLVRDENNDVINLIGYINDHGDGWFPFDDIQIECAQYDILACVN